MHAGQQSGRASLQWRFCLVAEAAVAAVAVSILLYLFVVCFWRPLPVFSIVHVLPGDLLPEFVCAGNQLLVNGALPCIQQGVLLG